ncbi:hypothetical protein [Streptomyces sp. DG1A-41]|uniref:hypothetical protein n=1 Tax=Streptomyces sp. DG1A-41 TaxID=3125779 RepID=UPI0030CF0CA2
MDEQGVAVGEVGAFVGEQHPALGGLQRREHRGGDQDPARRARDGERPRSRRSRDEEFDVGRMALAQAAQGRRVVRRCGSYGGGARR